jgi:hypothetical protein
MSASKLPTPPAPHHCPVCHFPQTKIQRKLDGNKQGGATNYVCTRADQCALGINLSKVDTWVAVLMVESLFRTGPRQVEIVITVS